MNFISYLKKDLICLFNGIDKKKEAINKLIDMTAQKEKIDDVKGLRASLFYREKLMSTGIGLGIAIPHVRFKGVKEPVIAIGIQPRGINDYKSLDDKVIKIVILIIVGQNHHKEHIKILAQIVSKLKEDNNIDRLSHAESPDDIFNILTRKK
ncbi:MAG: PTS sugar transporter subunit IIA [Spirochaetes bacterium]|nr:PTS sugar transporter subunit IIA [Spirochaetota bacterium]